MATVGTFTIIRNEARWIRAHLLSWLCFVDQMVFFDGNSIDGTLEIIKDVRANHPFGKRITLVEDKDPKDLAGDYQRVFNECLNTLHTDYAVFAHPDMILDDAGNIGSLGDKIAYTSSMMSFAGEPDGQLFEIVEGRTDKWLNIFRLRKPNLGLHYYGDYGAENECCYFSKITGAEHIYHGDNLKAYPFEVGDSGIKILHFSDVRPIERRIDRMKKCLISQGKAPGDIDRITEIHPRVTLQDGYGFKFIPAEYPDILKEGVNA